MVATTRRYCWKYIYISADNVPLPIFVHLLHGYSQNCYSVGIEFPLNLNLDFPCNPMDEILVFFTRYSPKKSSWVRWWNILRVASQNIEQFISDKWKNLKTAWGSMHIFCSLENGVELCKSAIASAAAGCSDVVFPPPSEFTTLSGWATIIPPSEIGEEGKYFWKTLSTHRWSCRWCQGRLRWYRPLPTFCRMFHEVLRRSFPRCNKKLCHSHNFC